MELTIRSLQVEVMKMKNSMHFEITDADVIAATKRFRNKLNEDGTREPVLINSLICYYN